MKELATVAFGNAAKSAINGDIITFSEHKFSGGEIHMTLDADQEVPEEVQVIFSEAESCDLMKMIQVADILRRNGAKTLILILPYLYYSRQDRATTTNSSFALKLFMETLQGHYSALVTYDPHSEVCMDNGIANKLMVLGSSQSTFIEDMLSRHEPDFVCAPDAGASEKIYQNMEQCEVTADIITATKKRDPSTGALSDPQIETECDLAGKHVLIADDICDGGYTFIQLAKVLREAGVETLGLMVSHGIFSKGFDELNKYFDYIETTDSFYTGDDIPKWNVG